MLWGGGCLSLHASPNLQAHGNKEKDVDIEQGLVDALEGQRVRATPSARARRPGCGQVLSLAEGLQLGRNESARLEPQVPCGARKHGSLGGCVECPAGVASQGLRLGVRSQRSCSH